MKNFYPAIFAAIMMAVVGNAHAAVDDDVIASKGYVDAMTVQTLGVFNETVGDNVTDLSNRVDGLADDVDGLTSDVSGLRSDVSDLQGDVSGLQSDVGDLQSDVGDLQQAVNGDGSSKSLAEQIAERQYILKDGENVKSSGTGVVKSVSATDGVVTVTSEVVKNTDLESGLSTWIYGRQAQLNNTNVTTTDGPGVVKSVSATDGELTATVSQIVTNDIADDAITAGKIKNGAVTTDKIEDGAITGDKIADGAIDGSQLDEGSITGDKIKDGAVTEGKLGDDVYTWIDGKQDELNASNVTSEGTGVVKSVTAKDGEVTIMLNTVDTDEITDLAVTKEKLAQAVQDELNQIIPRPSADCRAASGACVLSVVDDSYVWINITDPLED